MKTSTKAILAAGAVVGLAAAWYLGSPLILDQEVDEDFPMSASAIVPDDMTRSDVETEMEDAADAPDDQAADDMPAGGPTAVRTGTFQDADDFHQGSGTATIYELDDGSHVLRLEDFEVTNGPDLHVLLVPADAPTDRDDIEGYVDLGSLKGNIGNQNYEIPADLSIDGYGSVMVYCQPFHVVFSVASLDA